MARGLRSETENTMSNSISTLLLRNLSDVFGGNDPVRRRAASQFFFDFTGGANAMAASAVNIRKVNVSCKYRPTVASVCFK